MVPIENHCKVMIQHPALFQTWQSRFQTNKNGLACREFLVNSGPSTVPAAGAGSYSGLDNAHQGNELIFRWLDLAK